MTVKTIIKELTKREGLKKSIDIAQVTELVGHLSDLVLEKGLEIHDALISNGVKRAQIKVRALKKARRNATTK